MASFQAFSRARSRVCDGQVTDFVRMHAEIREPCGPRADHGPRAESGSRGRGLTCRKAFNISTSIQKTA